jgi:Kdo2-lipid IVA lauroyltransferase/acyltransferase
MSRAPDLSVRPPATLAEWLTAILVATLKILFRALPWKAGYWIGEKIADVVYFFAEDVRRGILLNFNTAFGPQLSESERNEICRGCFRHAGAALVECCKLSRSTLARLDERVIVEGEEHLKAALALGRGAIIATGHFGNYEYLAARHCTAGYPTHAVVANDNHREVHKLHAAFGLKAIGYDRMASRKAHCALNKNETVILVIDKNITPAPVEVRWFGGSLKVPRGAILLAQRSGAPILYESITRLAGGFHRLKLHPPIDLRSTGDSDRDIHENMSRLIELLEADVRAHPEQWALWAPIFEPKQQAESTIRSAA